MKRIAIIILFIFVALSALAELNNSQQSLRSNIMTFLKEEGYMPTIDGDGDLQLKIQGKTYYVSVSESDASPMYVRLSRYFNYPSDYSRIEVKVAAAELSLYKTVKVLCLDSQVLFQTEMYVQEPEAFKYAFFKMVSQLQSACNDFDLELENARNEIKRSR